LADETGIVDDGDVRIRGYGYGTTIVRGPLPLPADREFKVFDISGREVHTVNPGPGIYFVVIDNSVTQKVIKVR
jgi:hypothetical protein